MFMWARVAGTVVPGGFVALTATPGVSSWEKTLLSGMYCDEPTFVKPARIEASLKFSFTWIMKANAFEEIRIIAHVTRETAFKHKHNMISTPRILLLS